MSGNPLVSTTQELAFTPEQVELVKNTICRGATNDELKLFLTVCHRKGLDPFSRQIHAVRRRQKVDDKWQEVMVIQTGIDGYRLIAERTGEVDGQDGPYWCGKDGAWVEVWTEDVNPHAAKVVLFRSGRANPFTGVAHWDGYVQRKADGNPVSRWANDPAGMLAKCAEALALRKAFPQELSGIYTDVEMGQADNPPAAPKAKMPKRKSKASKKTEPAAENFVTGPIDRVDEKSGVKKDGKTPWVRYGIKIGEKVFGTFDEKVAEAAQYFAGTGEEVRLSFEQDGRYLNATGIEAVEGPDDD